MTSNDPTGARTPDDQDIDADAQPAQGQDDVTLTTDDDAQRDDLTVEPGNS